MQLIQSEVPAAWRQRGRQPEGAEVARIGGTLQVRINNRQKCVVIERKTVSVTLNRVNDIAEPI